MRMIVLAVLLLMSTIAAANWNTSYHRGIATTLVKNEVRGCGEFRYKESDFEGEYIVQCTSDGDYWTTYKVWPGIQKVSRSSR